MEILESQCLNLYGDWCGKSLSPFWRRAFFKPFKTIDQQIEILTARGLHINDIPKAKKYLLSNNYYNIVNGYGKFFQTTQDTFVDGATFDELSTLYIFDKDIKRTILQAILTAEHHIKSITAHRFAEENPEARYAYLNSSSYADDKILEVGTTISRLAKIINFNKRFRNNPINHYVNQHNDVPIWVLTDFLEFGDLRMIIESLPTKIQNNIAKDLVSFIKTGNPNFNDVFPPETMISFLKNINQTRNICAHNNRLLNYNCHANSVYFAPIHDKAGLKTDNSRKSVYSTIISLQIFISHEEFVILWNAIRKRIRKLSNKLNSIDINIINHSLGFPTDWHLEDPLK